MRAAVSVSLIGGAVCLALAGAAVGGQPSRRPEPVAEVARPAPVAAPVETDAERRDRLNARLGQMLREGKGARLEDRVARPAPAATRRAKAARPAPSRPAATETPETYLATTTPPAWRGGSAPAPGRGYRAPILDLVTPPSIPANDLECLTQAVYYEARNESEEGQAAVAEVVINRSKSGRYPRSICQVVYQRNSRTCQFTFTCDGSIGRRPVSANAWARAERIARGVHEGRSSALLPARSVNYHANYVRPSWGRRLERVRQIGAHIFYGAPLNGSTPGADTAPVAEKPTGGSMFVRNEALDRAYAAFKGETTATTGG